MRTEDLCFHTYPKLLMKPLSRPHITCSVRNLDNRKLSIPLIAFCSFLCSSPQMSKIAKYVCLYTSYLRYDSPMFLFWDQ